MPGLIDAHTHATGASLDVGSLDKLQPSYLAHYAGRYLRNMLQQGFTSIRDAGGGEQGLVQALEEGLLQGLRYLIAGKALSQTGGHGDMRGHHPQRAACRRDVVDGVAMAQGKRGWLQSSRARRHGRRAFTSRRPSACSRIAAAVAWSVDARL
jgi:imidazolonepropionase-like amidohydrolase